MFPDLLSKNILFNNECKIAKYITTLKSMAVALINFTFCKIACPMINALFNSMQRASGELPDLF